MNLRELIEQLNNGRTVEEIGHDSKYNKIFEDLGIDKLRYVFTCDKSLPALYTLYEKDKYMNFSTKYDLDYFDRVGEYFVSLWNRTHSDVKITSYSKADLTCMAKAAVHYLYRHDHEQVC